MADFLIFRIGFDLEAAVKKAQGDWSSVQHRMETMINSRHLIISLKIGQIQKDGLTIIDK